MKLFKESRLLCFLGLLVMALLGTFFLETFFYNRKAFFNKLDLELTLEDCEVEVDDFGSTTVKYEFGSPTYVDKLILNGSAKYNVFYDIILKYVNEFDKEKESRISDTYVWCFEDHVTPIRKTITQIAITNPLSLAELEGICFVNRFEWNPYRMGLTFSILFLVLNIIFMVNFYRRKPELLFLLIGLLMGGTMIFMQGPGVMGWDEEIHYNLMHQMSYNTVVQNSITTEALNRIALFDIDSIEEKHQQIDYLNENAKPDVEMSEYKENNDIPYNRWGYLPQAVCYRLTQKLGGSHYACHVAGRYGNLCMYLLLLFLAIKVAKSGKMILICTALLPTPLFIATTYTYDSFVQAFFTLGFVLLYNQWVEREEKWYLPFWCVVLFGIGCMPKAVYIPLVLLAVLLVDKDKLKTRKGYSILYMSVVCLVFLVVMSTFVLPAITNVAANNASFGGDSRGGDTSAVLQLLSVFEHPIEYTKLLIKNMVSFDTFGAVGVDRNIFPNLAFLNMGRYGVMPDKYSMILIPYLICLCLFGKERNVKIYQRITSLLAIAAVVVLIWTALYLSFTPVGENYMTGVQARYYLPLVAPIMLVLPSCKLRVNGKDINEFTYARLFWSVAVFFLWYGIYNNMLKATCL